MSIRKLAAATETTLKNANAKSKIHGCAFENFEYRLERSNALWWTFSWLNSPLFLCRHSYTGCSLDPRKVEGINALSKGQCPKEWTPQNQQVSALSEKIPAIAHFIWFGTAFPWVNALAIKSLAARGGFDRIILHHADDLSKSPWWEELLELEGFEAHRLSPESVLEEASGAASGLVELYKKLTKPAAKANMVRAALLHNVGGVYLDLDTVTIDDLTPLRSAEVFCGEEHLALPRDVATSRSPIVLAKAGARLALRDAMRRAPGGWRPFRSVERFYDKAVNNAVLGARAGHPFLVDLLGRMVSMDPARQLVRFALGTHLLQEVVAAHEGQEGLVVHPPPVFFPLSPEISEHWFRATAAQPRLDEILRPETRVVHWYASVRTKKVAPLVDPDYVRAHADSQPFSALAKQFLTD